MNRFVIFIVSAVLAAAGMLAIVSGGEPLNLLLEASPLFIVALLAGTFAAVAFVFGAVTEDYSWVDRLWSTAPVLFVWVYAAKGAFDARLVVAAAAVTVWGIRLTYNFARKGGYSGAEDYRWAILRQRIANRIAWQLFHLLFICAFQVGLFVLFTLPFDLLFRLRGAPLDGGFLLLTGLLICLVLLETVADQQQWEFQSAKRRGAQARSDSALNADLRRGFLTSGLFRLSRHPNYFAEISLWWCVYLMGAYQTAQILNATVVGAALLTVLFVGSTRFTESISGSRYPEYADYRRRTSAIIPWFPSCATGTDGQ